MKWFKISQVNTNKKKWKAQEKETDSGSGKAFDGGKQKQES